MADQSRRETIEPNPGDKRYVRRNEQGEFTEQDDVGRSLGPFDHSPKYRAAA
ncbi:MAG TPA: hypothetical protein VF037_01325 [Gemmatimonadales bacterium]